MVIKENSREDLDNYNDNVLDQIEAIDLYTEVRRKQEQFQNDIKVQGHDIEEVTFDDMFIEQVKTPDRTVVNFDDQVNQTKDFENKYDLKLEQI